MTDKYFIKGEIGNEYIMYGNEVESIYIAKIISHNDAVKMVIKLNVGD